MKSIKNYLRNIYLMINKTLSFLDRFQKSIFIKIIKFFFSKVSMNLQKKLITFTIKLIQL